MSDDLIARLRDAHSFMGDPLLKEAADALAEQAARVEVAEARAKDRWQHIQRLWLLAHGRDPDKGERLPMCRDCADFDGRCQGDGLPCDPQAAAEEMIRRKWADVSRAALAKKGGE